MFSVSYEPHVSAGEVWKRLIPNVDSDSSKARFYMSERNFLFYSVLEQVDFSFQMFGVALVQKSEFLFFVLSCVLYNYTRCPADGLSCLNLLLSSVSWGDLQKISCKENMELGSLPGRAPEFLHDVEKLDVL